MPEKGIDMSGSISRCDLYSNPYDTRMQARPAIIKQRAESFSQQDTLSSAKSFDSDILKRLQAKEIPYDSLLVLAALGKYAFLAIVLPPYIFCYGIPKWLMTEGLPKVYNVFSKVVKNITDRVADALHKGGVLLKSQISKVTSPILLYIKTRVDKTLELFSDMKNRALYAAGYPYRLFDQKVITPIIQFIESVQSGFEKATAGYAAMKEKLHQTRQALKHFFVYLPNSLQDAGNKFYQWFEGKWGEMTSPLVPFLNAISNAYQKTSESLRDVFSQVPFDKLKGLQESLKMLIKGTYEKATNPLLQLIDPQLEALRERYDLMKGKLGETLYKGKEKIKQKLKEFSKNLSDRVNEGIRHISDTSLAVSQGILQFIPQPVMSLFTPLANFVKSSLRLRKVKRVTPVWMKKVREKLDSGLKQAFNFAKRLENLAKHVLKKAYHNFKRLPRSLFKFLKKVFTVLFVALKGTCLIFLLMFAWGAALLRLGMKMVRNTTRELLFSSH